MEPWLTITMGHLIATLVSIIIFTGTAGEVLVLTQGMPGETLICTILSFMIPGSRLMGMEVLDGEILMVDGVTLTEHGEILMVVDFTGPTHIGPGITKDIIMETVAPLMTSEEAEM